MKPEWEKAGARILLRPSIATTRSGQGAVRGYEWAIQPALEDSDRTTAWWLDRSTDDVLVSKVTYLHLGHAA